MGSDALEITFQLATTPTPVWVTIGVLALVFWVYLHRHDS